MHDFSDIEWFLSMVLLSIIASRLKDIKDILGKKNI
jgi:hypothetical protein